MKTIDTKEKFLDCLKNQKTIEQCIIENFDLDRSDIDDFLTQIKIKNIIFQKVEFNNVTLSDVIFDQCIFNSVVFNNTTIKFTKFRNCEFEVIDYLNTKFNEVKYIFCKIFDCLIKNCDFVNITSFISCDLSKMDRCTREIFRNCTFSKFEGHITFDHTILPLSDLFKNLEDLKYCHFMYCGSLSFCPIINIGPIGSRDGCTTYIPQINWVQCGCWKQNADQPYSGGTLGNFEKRVNMEYPSGAFHDEYMAAIQLFKVYRDQYRQRK